MPNTLRIARLGLLGLTLVATPALAVVFKWIDANGNVHYSQQPPEHVKNYQELDINIAPGAATTTRAAPGDTGNAGEGTDQNADKTKSKEGGKPAQNQPSAEQAAAQKKAEADQKKRNCEIAQQNLKALQGGRRVMMRDGDQQRYVSDAERSDMVKKAQEDIQKYCN
ncbi:MAG: DUF4124 domain-containing protein [Gammaproteobacteria bacterium]|jgi:hypothetical protein